MLRQIVTRRFSSSPSTSSLIALASEYISWDPNPTTRVHMEHLLTSTLSNPSQPSPLLPLLSSRLQFGTAGLRAPFGPGYNAMNDLTVIQTAQGLLSYLTGTVPDLATRGIVIGYDHRASTSFTPYKLSSKSFAQLTHAVFSLAQIPVYAFDMTVATPIVAYGVRHTHAAAGVMVTASHNPMADTGYKVYWGNGAQITAPHDENISRHILENLEPWEDYKGVHTPANEVDIIPAYFAAIAADLCTRPTQNSHLDDKITYTAMHGVGDAYARQSFSAFNLPPYVSTKSQEAPDPEFPTVEFPNPEEGKGALEEAMRAAEANASRVIIANDPDADRLAVAERSLDGEWRLFTGNEIGAVLGHWQWRKGVEKDKSNMAMVASTVSSKFLGAVATQEGFLFEETLTGFKWMGNRSEELRAKGYDVVFSYEEAIGYCLGDVVLDKDGVAAAAVLGEVVGELREEGRSIADYLEELQETYGFFVQNNGYVRAEKEALEEVFERVRDGGKYVNAIGGISVKSVRDLTTGFDSGSSDNKATLPTDSSSQFVTFTMSNGAIVSLRGSGTEPKLKYYVEAVGATQEQGEAVCEELVAAVKRDLIGGN